MKPKKPSYRHLEKLVKQLQDLYTSTLNLDNQRIKKLEDKIKEQQQEIFRQRYVAVNQWISSVAELNKTIAQAIGEGLEDKSKL